MVDRAYSEDVKGDTRTARRAYFLIDVPFGSGKRVAVMHIWL